MELQSIIEFLQKLDALLEAEEPPEGLDAVLADTDFPLDTVAAADRAWRWFRGQLGADGS